MSKTIIFSSEIKDYIINNYINKIPIHKIAKEQKCSQGVISKLLKSSNIKVEDYRLINFNKEQQILIEKEYNKNTSLLNICNLIKCSKNKLMKFLINQDYYKGIRKKDYNFSCAKVRNNPFLHLTNETYYWLGFLVADGSVTGTRVSVGLKSTDKEHLEKFNKYLGGEIKISNTLKDNIYKGCDLAFRNKPIVETLQKYGITERKTFTIKLNLNLNWHFLRGLIDGDGSFSISKKGNKYYFNLVTASKELSNQIKTFFDNEKIDYNLKFNSKGNCYDFRIFKKLTLIKLIGLLYQDANTFLDRKYSRATYIRNDILKSVKFREPALGILSEIGVLYEDLLGKNVTI